MEPPPSPSAATAISPALAPAPATSLSLVSRARTAIHSAAAKAEKVLTDIKADLRNDRDDEGLSTKGSKKSSEHEVVGSGAGTKPDEELSKKDSDKEATPDSHSNVTIPPVFTLKQLATAIESTKDYTSIKDLLTLPGDSLLGKEKAGLRFSAVKSLVIREKEDKTGLDFCSEEFQLLLHTLFDTEDSGAKGKANAYSSTRWPMMNLPSSIHGAPPNSFVSWLAEAIGGLKSLQKMASFWCLIVTELRRLWSEGQPIPHMPLDANPDLKSCLLHQQLQVFNCCIARKARKADAMTRLDLELQHGNLIDNSDNIELKHLSTDEFYARIETGEFVLRLGADHPCEDLTMLETDEPIYQPVMQEGPVLTEDLIKETEELILRTGSVGVGCSQLLSDMQAFKAANPGCILEDFIRWHSPPDWMDAEPYNHFSDLAVGEGSSSRRGRLSRRMQEEGNLWHELWETAKPLPAVSQAPLFDEDLAVESILATLENIPPAYLFEQLFVSMLSVGFLVAETTVLKGSNLSKLLCECKDYVSSAFQANTWSDNISDICKVYETVQNVLLHPEEAIMITEQEEEISSEQPKTRFKKISLNFLNKDKHQSQSGAFKEEKKLNEKNPHGLSQLFDKKKYLFGKRHSRQKDEKGPNDKRMSVVVDYLEQEWTLV